MGGGASVAHATVVEVQSFKGSQATADFSATTSLTCADGSQGTASVSGFLTGAQSITRQAGTRRSVSNGALLEIFGFSNSCTGDSIGFGEGGAANVFTPPDRKLSSAAVDGSFLVQDLGSGTQFPVSVDIVIEGTGPSSPFHQNSVQKFVDSTGHVVTVMVSHFSDASRAGTASGTITIAGVEFTPVFDFASLSSNDNSSITVEK